VIVRRAQQQLRELEAAGRAAPEGLRRIATARPVPARPGGTADPAPTGPTGPTGS